MLLVFVLTTCLRAISALDDLYILGLFPFDGIAWRGGYGMLTSAEIAIEHVNKHDYILPGYRLNLIYNNTMCDPGQGIKVMYDNLYSPPTKLLIIGAGCSPVSEATAQASHLWNLVQMSYVSLSPSLSDKLRFPFFFRTTAPDVVVNPARIDIFKQFGWSQVSTIHQSFELFSTVTENLNELMKEANLTIVRSEIFTQDPEVQVKNLMENDARIIVGGFYADKARKIFCEAYKEGLYGSKVVWILVGWYDDDWWKTPDPNVDCTVEELSAAVEGYIAIDHIYLNPKNTPSISGVTPEEFQTIFNNRTNNENIFGKKLSPLAYDTIWAIALGLNETIEDLARNDTQKNLTDFTYTDSEFGHILLENMKKVNFQGIKGPIYFDENHDAVSLLRIVRIQGGVKETIGIYNPTLTTDVKIEWLPETPVVWAGGLPPKDSTIVYYETVVLSFSIYVAFCCISGIGMVLAIVFLMFNIMYRNARVVKMSSPRLNNLILIGCILIYITVFLYNTTENHSSLICQAKIFLMTVGFSLAFGALFAKTWRVHVIFTNATKQKKIVKDIQLVFMVLGLTSINLVVLIVWAILHPIIVVTNDLPKEVNEVDDYEIRKDYSACTSENEIYYTGTLFGIQGILMLLGAFLAWETRKVKIEALNDSKLIGVCIYNVVVLSILGVTVSFALGDNINLRYSLDSAVVLLATTVTECLIFVPKVSINLIFRLFT
ncbi:hypothetical protein LOTGIDRAFT_133032 [Lottia gigantea]|uniref:Gamma-aminobutyric acid type B receptor subunit 2 n=1 Tax=Lottia gigantea TaxID=225164 RepID=V3YZP5_LOTGI|nr:hypothetical protein LOTGIDRAFT_133032 [Lottia gigantea]ESO83683.1 hypothetical protein LOTGIDRAFT_133032 [Lottia gigantea]